MKVPPPVLFLAYNRPDLTKLCFDQIRNARPKRLFVAVDGPKNDMLDRNLCRDVLEVTSNIDWDCNCEFLIRETNLGCSRAIEDAIGWFFSHVDAGIILEDDCMVDQSFFPYAAALLDRYRLEEQVSMVSGFSFTNSIAAPTSYRFSRLSPVWGWATWAHSWERFSSSMSDWDSEVLMGKMKCYGSQAKKQFRIIENEFNAPELRTWGVQWRYRNLMDNKLCTVPSASLVQNLGFGHPKATKQKAAHSIMKQEPNSIKFPLCHPSRLVNSPKLDEQALERYYAEKERG